MGEVYLLCKEKKGPELYHPTVCVCVCVKAVQ